MDDNHLNSILSDVREKCSEMDKKIDVIRDNHMVHIQNAINDTNIKITSINTDLEWLKKSYWIMATPVIATLTVGVINLIAK